MGRSRYCAGAALGIGAGGLYMINKIRQQRKSLIRDKIDDVFWLMKLNKRKQMLQLGNSYQPEGEVVEGYVELEDMIDTKN